jgi:flagellar biosynthesis GTPase FlhF
MKRNHSGLFLNPKSKSGYMGVEDVRGSHHSKGENITKPFKVRYPEVCEYLKSAEEAARAYARHKDKSKEKLDDSMQERLDKKQQIVANKEQAVAKIADAVAEKERVVAVKERAIARKEKAMQEKHQAMQKKETMWKRQLEEAITCPICLEHEKNTLIIPCGHRTCVHCSPTFGASCPKCRGPVTGLQLFHD